MAKWSGDGGTKKKTKDLVGSKSCDNFKAWHKTALDRGFYASDIDLVLISKDPAGIVAVLDFKTGYDSVTFTEVILYNALIEKGIPVFIVTCDVWEGSGSFQKFTIEQYTGGDWKPSPPTVELKLIGKNVGLKSFEKWERKLRDDYKKVHELPVGF